MVCPVNPPATRQFELTHSKEKSKQYLAPINANLMTIIKNTSAENKLTVMD